MGLTPRFSTRVVLDVDHYVPMSGRFERDLREFVRARTSGIFRQAKIENPLRDCVIAAVVVEETHELSKPTTRKEHT